MGERGGSVSREIGSGWISWLERIVKRKTLPVTKEGPLRVFNLVKIKLTSNIYLSFLISSLSSSLSTCQSNLAPESSLQKTPSPPTSWLMIKAASSLKERTTRMSIHLFVTKENGCRCWRALEQVNVGRCRVMMGTNDLPTLSESPQTCCVPSGCRSFCPMGGTCALCSRVRGTGENNNHFSSLSLCGFLTDPRHSRRSGLSSGPVSFSDCS